MAGAAPLLFPNTGTDPSTYEAFARRLVFYAHAWRQRADRDRESYLACRAEYGRSRDVASTAAALAASLNCANIPTYPSSLRPPSDGESSGEPEDEPLPHCLPRSPSFMARVRAYMSARPTASLADAWQAVSRGQGAGEEEEDEPAPCWGRRRRARARCRLSQKLPADPVEAARLRLIAASAALVAANREIEASRDAHAAAVKVVEDLRAAIAARDADVPELKPEADCPLPADPELRKALEAAARADDS